jgi:hypothetical protein
LSHSSKIEYYESRKSRGYDTPLDFQPDSTAETEQYLSIYSNISHFRTNSMNGVGSVNMNDIFLFHEKFKYGTIEELFNIMIALDREFIKFYSRKD